MLRWQASFALAAFWKAELEHLLFCLQRVNSSHIVAWDVAFLLGSQGPCLPPLPSPKEKEGEEDQLAQEPSTACCGPPPGPRSSPSHPQEARSVRGGEGGGNLARAEESPQESGLKPQSGSLDPFFFLDLCPWLDYLTQSRTCVLEALTLVQLRP